MLLDQLPNIAAIAMGAAFAIEFAVSWLLIKDNKHDVRDTATAISLSVGYVLFSLLRGLLLGGMGLWIYNRMPWQWDSYHPLSMLICFVLVDFFHYWSHRTSHAFSFMWAFHAVHHSSTKLNLSTGFRNSWFGGFIDWVFIIPPAFFGFHPLLIAAATAVMSLWDFMCHTQYVGRLPVIDFLFNSPTNHRVHHGLAERDQHRNFGGMLFIWDRLFGTYQADMTIATTYGIDPPSVRPYNPVYLELFLLPGFRRWLHPSRSQR
jgi:sterol desaturase/sphingolipid hydroxylase (fatty acid hydroxylase superfamily)